MKKCIFLSVCLMVVVGTCMAKGAQDARFTKKMVQTMGVSRGRGGENSDRFMSAQSGTAFAAEAKDVDVSNDEKPAQKTVCKIFLFKELDALESAGVRVDHAGYQVLPFPRVSCSLEAHKRSSCWMYPFWEDKNFIGYYKFMHGGEEYCVLVFRESSESKKSK